MARYILNASVIVMLACAIFSVGCQEGRKKAEAEQPVIEETQPVAEQAVESKEVTAAETTPVVVEEQTKKEIEQPKEVVKETQPEPNKPSVLVTVNGVDITEEQLNERLQPLLEKRASAGQQTSELLLEQYKSRILDDMISNLVIEEQLKANNISVTEQDVNDVVYKLLSFNDPPQNDYNWLKSQLEAQGRTVEQWKQQMGFEQKIQMERLMNILQPEKLQVTDEEAQKFYNDNPKYFNFPEQVKASHILIKPENTDPNNVEQAKAAAKAKAEGLLKQIREGANFEDMARQHSVCPSAKNGGDLGLFSREAMVPEFSNAAFALKPGEISDVVETSYGFHIIKLTEHKDPYTIPFEKMKERIIYTLKDQKLTVAVQELLKEMKEKASIVYPPGSELRASQPVMSTIRKEPGNTQTQPPQ